MPEDQRYNRLIKESKLLIKKIAYEAETTLVNLTVPYYANIQKDGRTLLKEFVTSPVDISTDHHNKPLL